MEEYIYLCRSYTGAVNMLKQARGYAPELLGQLFVPRPESTECTIYVEVALGSPDIGDQLQEAMTMIPYIRLSCPRPDVVDMYAYISGSPSRLLGQLYVNLSPIAPRIWYFPSYKGSPDIGDGPDQQPPEVSEDVGMTTYTEFNFSRILPGVLSMFAGARYDDEGEFLGELYVNLPGPRRIFDSSYSVAPGSPDIGDEPEDEPQPSDAAARKGMPIARGVLDYFPAALLKLAEVSRVGNEQHNPGKPMHWAFDKSSDHADALLRHLIDRRTVDSDGLPHVAKAAWRALALLQTYLEEHDPELHARMSAQRAEMEGGR